MRQGREADWICPDANCHNKNFGWRTHCNRCQVRLCPLMSLDMPILTSKLPQLCSIPKPYTPLAYMMYFCLHC